MHRTFFVVGCLFVAACASGARATKTCDPLPADFQGLGELYSQCEVDQRVRLVNSPRADFSRLKPLGTSGCYSADYLFVVDAKGIPQARTVKMLRNNSVTYADAMREVINGLRFEPARKNGVAVPQLYLYEPRMRYVVTTSGSGASRRPPPC